METEINQKPITDNPQNNEGEKEIAKATEIPEDTKMNKSNKMQLTLSSTEQKAACLPWKRRSLTFLTSLKNTVPLQVSSRPENRRLGECRA